MTKRPIHDEPKPAEPCFTEAMRWLIDEPKLPKLEPITVEIRKLDPKIWGDIEP